ncbi:MAG: DCC1-like thiol-disulfide oxidoreductase family protein [Halobacteriales archaeon]|nr:DCC1-like thiol-disulfide oxidoreductase family protein [Halobacteriales archaeon]
MSDATLVYDDDCGFCTWWADLLRDHSDIRLVGFSELTDDLRDRLPADYRECSHLIDGDEVYSCGASIEEAFLRSDLGADARPIVQFARHFEEYQDLRERGYRFVADHRDLWGKVISKTPPARTRSDGS